MATPAAIPNSVRIMTVTDGPLCPRQCGPPWMFATCKQQSIAKRCWPAQGAKTTAVESIRRLARLLSPRAQVRTTWPCQRVSGRAPKLATAIQPAYAISGVLSAPQAGPRMELRTCRDSRPREHGPPDSRAGDSMKLFHVAGAGLPPVGTLTLPRHVRT